MNHFFYFFSIPIIILSQGIESNLPIIRINTNNQIIVDDPKITCDMGIIYNQDTLNNSNDNFNDYDGKISIEIRGSSSQMYPKKSYSFETQNLNGDNNNTSLLGLPEENDWILYAPYSDKSMLRNVLSYSLYEKMGNYAPRTRFCELIINNEYKGVYVLIEKIKRDKNRVNIKEMEEDDITGGYIVKVDRPASGSLEGQWTTNSTTLSGATLYCQYYYPKASSITDDQKAYIKEFINHTIELITDDKIDENQVELSEINLNSFIDVFIINELSKNIDGYRLSSYMYKDSDENQGKLTMGPIWDFNLGYGNVDYCKGYETSGWLLSDSDCNGGIPIFWEYLVRNKSFQDQLLSRWYSLRNNILDIDSIYSNINETVTKINDAAKRNFNKWNILAEYIWPNYVINWSYKGEIEYLKYWLFNRIMWIDGNIYDVALLPLCSSENKKLIKITDVLGRDVSINNRGTQIYTYDNGCIEKKYISYFY